MPDVKQMSYIRMIYPHHLVDAGMAVCYKYIQTNGTPLQQTQ